METPAAIWHVTDRLTPAAPPESAESASSSQSPTEDSLAGTSWKPPQGVQVEEIVIGHPDPINAGITALELRARPQEHADFEAFAQIESSLLKPREAELEVSLDGVLVDL